MARRTQRIPLSWDVDDEDWTAPTSANAASPSTTATGASTPPYFVPSPAVPSPGSATAPIILTASQQPKTVYKPEIQIMKRASAPTAPRAPAATPQMTESERERERKAKEQRYKETRDKIFNEKPTTPPTKTGSRNNKGGKRTPARSREVTPPGSGAATPVPTSAAATATNVWSPPPPAPLPQLVTTGAITGFSRNNATLDAAPVAPAKRSDWQLRQVALDGAMLESQAAQYDAPVAEFDPVAGGGGSSDGGGVGLDWDEFRRDAWTASPSLGDGIGSGLASISIDVRGVEEEERRVEAEWGEEQASGATKEGIVRAVRAPRGPDASGSRGFGRGRGGGAAVGR